MSTITRRFFYSFLLISLTWISAGHAEEITLTIMHVNDCHGRLHEENGKGGYARLASVVQQVKEESCDAFLLLHAGDVISRGDQTTVYSGGEANIRLMNALGFDVLTPGNGDFYWGVDTLLNLSREANFPFILANVHQEEAETPLLTPYIIREFSGFRVGILGLGIIRTDHYASTGLVLQNAVTVAEKYVPFIREEADIVIALTHIGFHDDLALASAVDGIDFIVGGHSHTLLQTPHIAESPAGNPVYIVQAGEYMQHAGHIRLRMQRDESGVQILSVEGTVIPLDEDVPEAPETLALLLHESEPLDEVICTLDIALPHPETGESPISEFILTALCTSLDVDAVLFCRDSLMAGLDKGEVTINDLCKVHPYRSPLVIVDLHHAELKEILDSESFISEVSIPEDNTRTEKRDIALLTGAYERSYIDALRNKPFRETGFRLDLLLLDFFSKIRNDIPVVYP